MILWQAREAEAGECGLGEMLGGMEKAGGGEGMMVASHESVTKKCRVGG